MKRDNIKIALFFIFVSFVLTMSVIMGVFLAMNSYVQQKKSNIPLYVFLKTDTTQNAVENFVNTVKQLNGVKSVKLINKRMALEQMVKKFHIDSNIFVGNPFPDSLEIFFYSTYTNENYFKRFREDITSPIVESVVYPKDVLKEIESIHSKVIYFSEIVIAVLYGVEFIVFLSIMTIFYSNRKFDYDTLKFFGIKRFTIFRLFLKETMLPSFYGFLFSVVLIFVLYFTYGNYGELPFMSVELFKSVQRDTFISNVVVGFVFTLLSSILVFLINDEKV